MLDGRFDPAFALMLTAEDDEEISNEAGPVLLCVAISAAVVLAFYLLPLLEGLTH